MFHCCRYLFHRIGKVLDGRSGMFNCGCDLFKRGRDMLVRGGIVQHRVSQLLNRGCHVQHGFSEMQYGGGELFYRCS